MLFSCLFSRRQPQPKHPTTGISLPLPPAPTGTSLPNPTHADQPNPTQSNLIPPNPTETLFPFETWCLPTQLAWINDPHPLRIWEKSRQVGATKTDALASVLKASILPGRRLSLTPRFIGVSTTTTTRPTPTASAVPPQ
ncbi:MAG TPA: hypothetical protein VG167_01980 [Verrucomicrobiae bacterium]|nr:hypothetical protein [Verrucomicrobiae bacterium]